MKLGLIGDIHGRVFHTLAAVLAWQSVLNEKLDLVIQVGDLGAFPDPDRLDPATSRFAREDPTELDFSRLLNADSELEPVLLDARRQLARPIHFIRGNHEDREWLDELHIRQSAPVSAVDRFDLFWHVADGTVLDFESVRIAFLGGIETTDTTECIDPEAYRELMMVPAGSIDLLVTHDAPFGIGTYRDRIQGSPMISALVETLQPRYHVAGHYHHMAGPKTYGETVYLGLSCLLYPTQRDPSRSVQPGSLALLDTRNGEFRHVTEDWLGAVGRNLGGE
ncbi:MAG: metallophosphoesterase family protein [Egibacteraceae bacterium]